MPSKASSTSPSLPFQLPCPHISAQPPTASPHPTKTNPIPPYHVLSCAQSHVIPEIRGWILKDETFRTSYWGPDAVLRAYRQISGSLFPINPGSFSKRPHYQRKIWSRLSTNSLHRAGSSAVTAGSLGAPPHCLSVATPCERCEHTQRTQFSVATLCRGARVIARLVLGPS